MCEHGRDIRENQLCQNNNFRPIKSGVTQCLSNTLGHFVDKSAGEPKQKVPIWTLLICGAIQYNTISSIVGLGHSAVDLAKPFNYSCDKFKFLVETQNSGSKSKTISYSHYRNNTTIILEIIIFQDVSTAILIS